MFKQRLGMQSTSTSLSFFIWAASYQMRLSSLASALVPTLLYIARVDASANAKTSPPLSGTASSTGDRSDLLISNPSNAKDEERVGGIIKLGWGDVAANFLTKYPKALREQGFTSIKDTWWGTDGADPHFVYAKLELDKRDESILSDVRFHAWVKQVHDYNLAHQEHQVSIMRKLHEQYGDRKLSLMLDEAKRDKSPLLRAIGTKLELELMSYWKNEKFGPQQLYWMLQSDEYNPRLLLDREYDIWNLYFSKFMPGESMDHFHQLYQTFSEKILTLLLISATRSKETEVYAHKLLFQLANVWLDRRKEPKFVFKQLLLDRNPDQLFDHAEVYIWLDYANLYKNRYKEKITLNQMLETYYSDDEIKVLIESTKTSFGKGYARELKDERKENLLRSTIESESLHS